MSDMLKIAQALGGTDNPLRLRQGVVSAVAADLTCTVTVAGSAVAVSGVKQLTTAYALAGDTVWLATDGRDLFVVGVLATSTNHRVMHTPEGGIAVRLTNAGATSVKGTLVSASEGTNNAFIPQENTYDTIGACYESGIATGELCWVVVTGRAQVLLDNAYTATRGHICAASGTDGRATGFTNPGSGLPGTDNHFRECGHFIESKANGTDVLAYAMLHFN